MAQPYYITTPIYYVNDRPHIGHCYTSLLADVAARFERMSRGQPSPSKDVFYLTGTDEHADKVVTSGAQHGMTPLQWADRNAAEFQKAFAFMGFSHDDFIRTTQERHKSKVIEYVRALQASGDVYLGDYVGWYDESQDEYLTETVAKDSPQGPYTSPVTGKPLVKRTEKNYFFKLSKYEARLRKHIDECQARGAPFVSPDARQNEVLGRLRTGLQDVPISRAVGAEAESQWGIRMPDDPSHRIYVWIDALFNYLSAVDNDDRRRFWPPAYHVMAKDILWFHAVIWPCMLMALKDGDPKRYGFVELPRRIYSHAYWVREGKKMSKSLGNFVTIEVLEAYAQKFSLDALRWYMVTQGPLGATDADFSHSKFVEVYNADLANGIGNCASRVGNMIEKYFDGKVPDPHGVTSHADYYWPMHVEAASKKAAAAAAAMDLNSLAHAGMDLVRAVDAFIGVTTPFKLAKEVDADTTGEKKKKLGIILYQCAETVRIATVLLSPILTARMPRQWETWNCTPPADAAFDDLVIFGGKHSLKPGHQLTKGEVLFMRADPAEAPPA